MFNYQLSDQLLSIHYFQEDGLSPREQELKDLKESLQDTQPVGVLVDSCRTMDQVRDLKVMKVFLMKGHISRCFSCHSEGV